MAIRGNRNGRMATVTTTWSRIREDRLRTSNIGRVLFASAEAEEDRHAHREDQQHDRQGRAVTDLGLRNGDAIDERAEEFGRVVRTSRGNQVRDVKQFQ